MQYALRQNPPVLRLLVPEPAEVAREEEAAVELEAAVETAATAAPNMEEQLERSPVPVGDAAYAFTGILRELESMGHRMAEQPAKMPLPLYPIQRQTLAWALTREASSLSGGLLSDEMGFGKTLIIAALVLMDDQPLGPTLVVVKKALLEQWRRELAKAQPDSNLLRVYVHSTGRWDANAAANAHVVLTTFAPILNAFGPLKQQVWRRVVVDESAQHLRTLSSKTGNNLRKLRATHRWILSGTAVDGKLTALAGQLAFLGVTGDAARPEWWEHVQADLSPTAAPGLRDAALRRTVVALSSMTMRHSHAQRFTHSGEQLIPLPRKESIFVAVPFERWNGNLPGHAEFVYRALEHLARLELKAGQGHPHSLFAELPASRIQELLLASTHASTVEAGEVSARMPMLQTCKADSLTADSLLPTRLVTLDLVHAGVSSDGQRRAVRDSTRCSMPECNAVFEQPGASSQNARVIANGCSHSYCKHCISELLLDRGADYQEIFCRHAGCKNRLQLGFLREVVSNAEYDASERALDDDDAWQALDKSRPPASALEKLSVSVCTSFLCDARKAKLGTYAGSAKCSDGQNETRILSTQLAPQPLAKADVILSGSLDGVGEAAREQYDNGGGLQCSICFCDVEEDELAALPCGHSTFCRPCLEDCYERDPRCPICRVVHVAEPLHFCDVSCAKTAFNVRVEALESDVPAGRACDGCPKPLPACHTSSSRKRKVGKSHGKSDLVYRCHWPKRTSGGVAGNGAAHMASKRFHSKVCAQRWFADSLQPLDRRFEGNRLLYQPGDNQRFNFDELTPLTRRVGDVWYRLGYEHADTAKGSLARLTEEWVDMLINFPGMQPHAFNAHLDAAAGSWSNPAQIPSAPKIKALLERIQAQEDDDKFLVFSQSKQLLELVAGALEQSFARNVDELEVGERIIVHRETIRTDIHRPEINLHLPCGARGTVKEPSFPVRVTDPETGHEWVETHLTVHVDELEDELEFRIDEVTPVPFYTWAKEGEDAMGLFRDEPVCCGLLLESGNFAAGLTLTSASTCFVLEPQLDAAMQAQLEGRVYRPGQTRDVKIVHLYTPGTVEERVVRHVPEFAAERIVEG